MPLLVSTSWGLCDGLLLVNLLSSVSLGRAGHTECRVRIEAFSKIGINGGVTQRPLLQDLIMKRTDREDDVETFVANLGCHVQSFALLFRGRKNLLTLHFIRNSYPATTRPLHKLHLNHYM